MYLVSVFGSRFSVFRSISSRIQFGSTFGTKLSTTSAYCVLHTGDLLLTAAIRQLPDKLPLRVFRVLHSRSNEVAVSQGEPSNDPMKYCPPCVIALHHFVDYTGQAISRGKPFNINQITTFSIQAIDRSQLSYHLLSQ